MLIIQREAGISLEGCTTPFGAYVSMYSYKRKLFTHTYIYTYIYMYVYGVYLPLHMYVGVCLHIHGSYLYVSPQQTHMFGFWVGCLPAEVAKLLDLGSDRGQGFSKAQRLGPEGVCTIVGIYGCFYQLGSVKAVWGWISGRFRVNPSGFLSKNLI